MKELWFYMKKFIRQNTVYQREQLLKEMKRLEIKFIQQKTNEVEIYPHIHRMWCELERFINCAEIHEQQQLNHFIDELEIKMLA
ncbi:MAG: hypothetical protein ACOCQR_01255 [bacterium]